MLLTQALVWLLPALSAAKDLVVLENATLRLAIDRDRGEIASLVDKVAGHDHRDSNPAGDLWTIVLHDGGVVRPSRAGVGACAELQPARQLEIRWSSFDCEGWPQLSVRARIVLAEKEPVSHWRIPVEGLEQPPIRSLHGGTSAASRLTRRVRTGPAASASARSLRLSWDSRPTRCYTDIVFSRRAEA